MGLWEKDSESDFFFLRKEGGITRKRVKGDLKMKKQKKRTNGEISGASFETNLEKIKNLVTQAFGLVLLAEKQSKKKWGSYNGRGGRQKKKFTHWGGFLSEREVTALGC